MFHAEYENEPRLTGKRASQLTIPLFLSEQNGIERVGEPVSLGLPLPKGAVSHNYAFFLTDHNNLEIPVQVKVLQRWPDKSLQWILVDFLAGVNAHEKAEYRLVMKSGELESSRKKESSVEVSGDVLTVRTGSGRFDIDRRTLMPFRSVSVDGIEVVGSTDCRVALRDAAGRDCAPVIQQITVEDDGPVRTTIACSGDLRSSSGTPVARFISRMNFYAATTLVQWKLTIRNDNAAFHRGGLWDLGDEGSILFKDFSVEIGLAGQGDSLVKWAAEPSVSLQSAICDRFKIYQDSSGGINWTSSNHVNRAGKVMHAFQGYRVTLDGVGITEGKRAQPSITLSNQRGSISVGVEKFWQNFPKALDVAGNKLRIGLFPGEYSDLHELQGGEQKTHTVWMHFNPTQMEKYPLSWIDNKLLACAAPDWYSKSGAILSLQPQGGLCEDTPSAVKAQSLVDCAVHGSNSFFIRREVIDEYGWRNFGDLYADHEAVGHQGNTPLIAHYNNQYDVIYGALVHYLRSGDPQWFRLMDELATHVMDIDVYRTTKDRVEYNSGMFWHTEHYSDASTATHRTYSKSSLAKRDSHLCGGGPSCGHNYTTGLLHYYYLTGDTAAKETVQGLADWILNLDDGTKNRYGWLDRRPTGLISLTVNLDYHGPGRGPGNSVNVLVDAYVLTGNERYRQKVEELICRCIHPKTDIQELHLEDVENRWSYTIFLQSLGKYLEMKVRLGQLDDMYAYAHASLQHYARWMIQYEVPYKTVLSKVEIPTETWPAQDIRKSHVLMLAGLYAREPWRSEFFRKAQFFFEACIRDLSSFDTCSLTRPIAILMTNAYAYPYLVAHKMDTRPSPQEGRDFGHPQRFRPQMYEIQKLRARLSEMVQSLKAMCRR